MVFNPLSLEIINVIRELSLASITKRGVNSWRITVYAVKDDNGKYIRRTKTVQCKTKKEAELELAKFQVEVESGEYIAPKKPVVAPGANDQRVLLAPRLLELIQLLQGRMFGRRFVDGLQRAGDFLDVLVGDVFDGVTDLMDHALLYLGLRIAGRNGVAKTG